MENHTPIFAQEAPSRPGRMTSLVAIAALFAVGIISFIVARTTARAELATVVSMENPIMPAAPAFMPHNVEGMLSDPVDHASSCSEISTCRNSKFKGQCAGCVQCMKNCKYPYTIRCYRIFAHACTV